MRSLPQTFDMVLWNTDVVGKPNAEGEPRWKVALYHYDPLSNQRCADSQLIVAVPVSIPDGIEYPEDDTYTESDSIPAWLYNTVLYSLTPNQKVTA